MVMIDDPHGRGSGGLRDKIRTGAARSLSEPMPDAPASQLHDRHLHTCPLHGPAGLARRLKPFFEIGDAAGLNAAIRRRPGGPSED